MARAKRKPSGQGPAGRIIDAGQVTFAGAGELTAGNKWRSLRETLEYVFGEYLKLADTLPKPIGGIIADCARRGLRKGQGKGRSFLSTEDKLARERAMKEAPALYAKYFAEAKATGAHRHPRRWAREKAAEAVRQRMIELGVAKPPAVTTIMKKLHSRSPT
ncbi:MAG TPA: hypothetical protein VGJ76_03275 [Pseudolabrys sp.]|jgi:hypothetical protein